MRKVEVVVSFELPAVSRNRQIWQPVTGKDGVKMRLAPLDWQPSGAHHALEYLAVQKGRLEKQNAFLEAKLSKSEAILAKAVGFIEDLTGCEWPYSEDAKRTLAELKGETDE